MVMEHHVHRSGAAVWQHRGVEEGANESVAAQRDVALDWLAGPDARAVARRRLGPLGALATDVVADVVQEAVTAVLVRFARPDAPPLDGGPDAGARYANRVLQNKATDVLRGARRAGRSDQVPWSERLADEAVGDIGPADMRGGTDDDRLVDLARMAVLVAPATGAVRSAALTYLAVDAVPTVPAGFGIPLPRAGASAPQRRMWPALWLAGQQALFDQDDSVARRKARSRAQAKVMDLLAQVLAEMQAQGLVSDAAVRGTH